MKNVANKIVERINREVGADIKNLHKCKNIVDEYRQRINVIEAELIVDNNNIPSKIKSTLAQCRDTHEIVLLESTKIDQFQENLSNKLTGYHKILHGVSNQLNKIRSLQHLVEYFKILKDIQEVSKCLTSSVKNRDDQKTIGLYLSLYGGPDSSNSIIGRLENVDANNLKTYAERTAVYWYDVLREKFSNDFESVLNVIKWPNLGASNEPINPTKDSLHKLMSAAEYLFLLKSPEEKSDTYVRITPLIVCPALSIPVELLLKSFRQRFSYHFTGARQTNRLDKPEWFFTQILTWSKENHIFVGTNIQPALNLAGHSDINVRLEFIRGLVQLTIEKLCIDIDEIAKNEHLFSHLIDETLSFEQEVRETLGYPIGYCSAISVLTQAKYLTKWLAIEEQFTTEKMDAILTTGDPWSFIDPKNFEEFKIPKCADQFIRLLDAIRERYCNLAQPGHQLQFLNLQLELIESFRRRLIQLHNSPVDNVTTTMVLNAINYLTSVLREWGENVHYLHLHAALFGPHTDEINSVFDKVVDDLEQWQRILVKDLSSKIVDDIKAKSMAYRHDNWISMSDQNALEPFILSVTAGEMLQLMVTSLHNLETELSINIFNIALRLIANQLDDFFIDSMIMNTKFSTGGASQFDFDMNRNLFALFGQYARRPDLLFKKIHDACKLLILPRGNALLLCETIKGDIKQKSNSKQALNEIGVMHISNLMALDILERRNDICSY